MLITNQADIVMVVMVVDVNDLLLIRSAVLLPSVLPIVGLGAYHLNRVGILRFQEDPLHGGCCCLWLSSVQWQGFST
jgi:hypothetical protein